MRGYSSRAEASYEAQISRSPKQGYSGQQRRQTPRSNQPISPGRNASWGTSGLDSPASPGRKLSWGSEASASPSLRQRRTIGKAIEGEDNERALGAYGSFGDPRGTIAAAVERCLFWLFVALAGYFLFVKGWWISALVIGVVGTPLCSLITEHLKLWLWKHASGIDPSQFQTLFELVESVCVRNFVERRGQSVPRLVCVGEVAAALREVKWLTQAQRYRFWAEACAHFRRGFRSGCEILGRHRPRDINAAKLAQVCPRLPTDVCESCANKTELETKFPVKFRE